MTNTVAFVQEWLMSGDHEPSQFDRDFAAAIDARCNRAARLAFCAGWWVNAGRPGEDGAGDHDYFDGCERTDWQAYSGSSKVASDTGAGLRSMLQEAHDTLHECTAVLHADDCRTVAAVMERIRHVLATPTDATDGATGGGEVQGILLPPAPVDDPSYMEGWLDGQTYLLLNQSEPEPAANTPGGDLLEQAHFLLDRLEDHENNMTSDTDANEWHGHVAPAIARFRSALAAAPTDATDTIGFYVFADDLPARDAAGVVRQMSEAEARDMLGYDADTIIQTMREWGYVLPVAGETL